MSAPNVREQIQRAIRDEAMAALDTAAKPLTLAALHRACPTSADLDDIRPVIRDLIDREEIVSQAINGGRCDVYRRPGRAGVAPAGADQTRVRRDPPASARKEPAPKPRGASTAPNGRAQRLIEILTHEQRWLTVNAFVAQGGGPAKRVMQTLSYLSSPKGHNRLAKRYDANGHREYGLPVWADRETPQPPHDTPAPTRAETPPPVAPTAATDPGRAGPVVNDTGPRFGLWSDGTLSIETEPGDVDLPPAVTRALIEYLIRSRPQVEQLFDRELDIAP